MNSELKKTRSTLALRCEASLHKQYDDCSDDQYRGLQLPE